MITFYLEKHKISLNNFKLSKKLALIISEIVYKEFNTNPKTWKHFNLITRPFLRNSVLELLSWKEGLCGEGARVIVRLLQKVGFDATRVNLYTPKLGGTGHVVVSVKLNNREFFVDTINSPSWFHKLVKMENIGPDCYSIIHYKQRFEKRRKEKKKEECKMLVKYYPFYSYEAIPFTKLLNFFGLDVYVFNLKRPSKVISYLAESPYLIRGIFWSLFFRIINNNSSSFIYN